MQTQTVEGTPPPPVVTVKEPTKKRRATAKTKSAAPAPAVKPKFKLPRSFKETADLKLIDHCITFVSMIAALDASYSADPDGNFNSAEEIGDTYLNAANAALTTATKVSAKGFPGLYAKGEVVLACIRRLSQHDDLNALEAAFIASFAADAKRLAEGAMK